MTTEQDPAVQTLFAIARQDLAEEAFTVEVMSRIDRQRRKAAIGWGAVYLVLVPCALFLVFLLQDAVQVVAHILPTTLIEMGDHQFAHILAPLNSVPSVIVVGLIALRAAYSKIVS